MKRAFLDANVLFSASLRDVLLWLAFRDVCEARFSAPVHEEWMRAVLKQRPHTDRASLEKTRDAMNKNIPGALVEGFEPLIEILKLPDPNDRHVLAAALHSGCDVIVTFSLADFSENLLPLGLTRQTPDEFLCLLLEEQPQNVVASLRFQRLNLKKPSLEVADFLGNLRNQNIPAFARRLNHSGNSYDTTGRIRRETSGSRTVDSRAHAFTTTLQDRSF